jgi:hypothetical protein
MSYDSLASIVENSKMQFKDDTDVKVSVIKIQPFGNSSFSVSGNREVQFKLPRNAIMIPSKSYLQFSVNVDGDAASNDTLQEDIHTVFDRFRLEVGSLEVFNEIQWGQFRALEQAVKMGTTDRSSLEAALMNIPDTVVSATNKKFRVPLCSKWNDVDFFSTFSMVPLFKLDTMTLTWTINPNITNFTSAQTAATSFQVLNPELVLFVVDSNKMRAQFDADMIKSFDTFNYYHSSVGSNVTNISVNIPVNQQNVRGVAAIMRDATTLNSGNYNWTGSNIGPYSTKKYLTGNLANGIQKYSVQIDGTNFPIRDVDTTNQVEVVDQIAKYWDINTLGSFYTASNMAASSNAAIYYPVSFHLSDESVSGQSMTNKSGTIIFNATSSGTNAVSDLDFFTRYTKFVRLDSAGNISVTQ